MVITAQDAKVKPGYKQSEVGVIPEDWEVKPLNQLSPRQCVGVVVNPSSYFDDEGTVPFLVGSNVGENSINWRTAKRISDASNRILGTTRLAAGDLVTVRVGEPGVTAVIPPELDGCNCASMMIVRQHPSFDSHWLCWVMNSRIGRLQVDHVQYGTAQKQFNISDAVDFCYPVPPLPEQRAIATALSDVDALIESLDRLIAKKRDIKQATMQQLLTGKARLPEFSGEWKVRKFGEIFQFLNTANNSRSDLSENGEIKYIHYGDIHMKWRSFLDCSSDEFPLIEKDKVGNVPFLEDGDLVMADASEDYEGIGISVEVKTATGRKVVAGLHTFLLRGDKEVLADGLKGYLQYLPAVKDSLRKAATGISVYGISKNNVKNISICLPDIPEQRAISSVFSDMDAEIAALEQRRDKTRALKQGMMQELLTGKTRLI